jgi:hypothetical protein
MTGGNDMTNRVIAGALTVLLTTSAVVSADDGVASRTAARSTRPLWTLVGVGAGFGAGLWAGLTAFDESINSDRKVWTSAIVGAAAGGILGYLVDRQRATSHTTPTRTSRLMLSPRDERDVISAARRLGDGQLKRWLAAREVSSIP